MQTQMSSKLAREIAKDRKRGFFRSSDDCRATWNIHKKAAMACKTAPDDDVGIAILRNVLAVALVVGFLVLVFRI